MEENASSQLPPFNEYQSPLKGVCNEQLFFMPPPAEGRSGAYSVFAVMLRAYVTFVTRFKFTCKKR